jgi:hypothetical protein
MFVSCAAPAVFSPEDPGQSGDGVKIVGKRILLFQKVHELDDKQSSTKTGIVYSLLGNAPTARE